MRPEATSVEVVLRAMSRDTSSLRPQTLVIGCPSLLFLAAAFFWFGSFFHELLLLLLLLARRARGLVALFVARRYCDVGHEVLKFRYLAAHRVLRISA
jgi:hypothetical protein